jgi:hypothetical protein
MINDKYVLYHYFHKMHPTQKLYTKLNVQNLTQVLQMQCRTIGSILLFLYHGSSLLSGYILFAITV